MNIVGGEIVCGVKHDQKLEALALESIQTGTGVMSGEEREQATIPAR